MNIEFNSSSKEYMANENFYKFFTIDLNPNFIK